MLANLRALFGVVVDLVLLRRGPEHLPASPLLLAIVIAVFAAATLLVNDLTGMPGDHGLALLAFEIIGTLLWFWLALQLSQKRERFVQTMTGLFIVNAIISPLSTPFAVPFLLQVQAEQSPSGILTLMVFGMLAWWVAASGNVIKTAFEWPWFAAILMLLAQKFSLQVAAVVMFGKAAAPA
jgi:hypothetical protein